MNAESSRLSQLKSQPHVANAIIRGEIISTNLVEFGGRGAGDFRFLSPDPHTLLERLALGHSGKMADLYTLKFDDILDYLAELGARLDLRTNQHLQQAMEGSFHTAPTTRSIIEYSYKTLRNAFRRDVVTEMAEQTVGIKYLEGWVPTTLIDGRIAHIRAFGSRALHIVAGNAPLISAMTIVRGAISRSDTIIKTPSNDPFTALAIVNTMCDMAPDHPLTKHISVAYWKGGDQRFENELYQPHNIEKIVAWGGLASVKHVTRYIQPGLELISLDPKRSISIVGAETFASDASIREAARKLAIDAGTMNQAGCVCARVAYVQSGTSDEQLELAKRFGRYTYEALMNLPPHMSTKPRLYDRELKREVEAIRLQDEWYQVIGGDEDEGAVIVSLLPEPVSFATQLDHRTINIVPFENLEEVFRACDAYTQTVGIFPESLKAELLDRLPLYGAQRIVSLGFATTASIALPQDSIEPLRRACKWIVNEQSVPETIAPIWPEP
ncbi:MAG: acyl-CoA reductase [Steroidobacteraceae bacterium]